MSQQFTRSAHRAPAAVAALAACLVCATGPAAGTAHADGFRLNPHRMPVLATDGVTVAKPGVLERERWTLGLSLDYAKRPLQLQANGGGSFRGPDVVHHEVDAQLGAAYGLLDNLALLGSLTVPVMMKGDALTGAAAAGGESAADGPGVGDARLGLRYLMLRAATAAKLSLAVEGFATVPTAQLLDDKQAYRGEGGFGADGQLLLGADFEVIRASINVGGRYRQSSTVFGSDIGPEVFGGAGLELPVHALADLLLEWRASAGTGDLFGRESTPMEVLAGTRLNLSERWTVKLAGGPGVAPGVGSPDYRLLAGVWYTGGPIQDAQANADTDSDGIADAADRCATEPEDHDGFQDEDGCPDLDNDGDGIADANDACADAAEDMDGVEDGDGCPDADLDGDGDGIADAADKCPAEPEDKDGFQDGDGCPDLDNDGDGVADADDKCPAELEDKDGFQDGDGCPDPDNDGDGIADADDKCPGVAGDAAHGGCSPKVSLDESQIRILERVEFAVGRDVVAAGSHALLKAVASIFSANAQLARVAVVGHTDNQGEDASNMALSTKRATAVRDWLVQAGVEAGRLEAWGCGEAKPLADNGSPKGRTKNRRVEFHLLDPAPKAPVDLGGCGQAK